MTQQWLEVVNALAPDKAKEELEKLPNVWYGVKDVIVTGEPQLITDIAPMLEKIGPIYAASAEALLRGTVVSKEESKTILSNFVSSFGAWMEQERMAPLLTIISMEPELLSNVKQGLSQYIQLICSADPLLGLKEQQLTYQGIEFSGFYLEGKLMAAMARDSLKNPSATVNVTEKSLEDWLKGLEKFSFYFLVGYKDDKVIISISRDPKKDLKLAASPQESILATDKLAFTDQAAQVLCVGYADAAMSEAFVLLKQKGIQGILAGVQYIANNMSNTMISLDVLNAHYQDLLNMSQANKATTLLALSGMDSNRVLVINDQGIIEGQPSCLIPRFAYVNGVSDWSKITSAGEIIQGSFNELLGSYAEPAEGDIKEQNIFQLQKTDKQGVTTYSYPSPFGMAGCKPCLSISDKVFIVGSLPAFNQEVAEAWSATQTGVFEGAMFAFKLAPALKMLSQNLSLMVPRTKTEQNDELLNIIKRVDQLFQGVYGTMKTEEGLTRWRLSIPIK